MKMIVGRTMKAKMFSVAAAVRAEHAGDDAPPHVGVAERPEHERSDPMKEKFRTLRDDAARALEHGAADVGLEHDQREDELQSEPPRDRAVVDGRDGPTTGNRRAPG